MRELVLRALLIVNLAAMVFVVMTPLPPAATAPDRPATSPVTGPVAPPPLRDPTPQSPPLDDPVVRAFAAADRHDYVTAIRLLEAHLEDAPRLAPSRRANLLFALEHYASQLGDYGKAQTYEQRAQALTSSHSLPEDLVQLAAEAERNGDMASMRRYYARLLLQQRQIPSSLHRHVAEAWLKLGDSYRQEAQLAEEAARQAELEAVRAQLRAQHPGGK